MTFREALNIPAGVTAVTGSGGKTTLLITLGRELAASGRSVLLCSTTKIYPFPNVPLAASKAELDRLRQKHLLLCAGTPLPESGKLTAPALPMAELAERFDYVLVEADGARGLPLKAHAPWEPAVPPEAARVICVVGASGFGRPAGQAVHRPELWRPADTSPGGVAEMLALESGWDVIYVNQCDGSEEYEQARRLAAALEGRPVLAGSLRKGEIRCL